MILKDDKQREVSLNGIFVTNGDFFHAEYLSQKKDLQMTCNKLINDIFGLPVVHVGKGIEALDKMKDYVIFADIIAGWPAEKKDGSHLGTNCSTLTLAWFDDDLTNIPQKLQKYLSTISWDDLARNFYD